MRVMRVYDNDGDDSNDDNDYNGVFINAEHCEHSEICIEIVGVDRRDEHI